MVTEKPRIYHVGDAPFCLPVEMGTRFILTGGRSAGKTTTLISWIDAWRAHGVALSGVYTKTLFVKGVHAGYDIVDVASGAVHPVIRRTPFEHSLRQGEFYFDEDGFDAINGVLLEAPPADLLIIDEIGHLELRRRAGLFPALHFFLQHTRPLLLVIRDTYLEALRPFL